MKAFAFAALAVMLNASSAFATMIDGRAIELCGDDGLCAYSMSACLDNRYSETATPAQTAESERDCMAETKAWLDANAEFRSCVEKPGGTFASCGHPEWSNPPPEDEDETGETTRQ